VLDPLREFSEACREELRSLGYHRHSPWLPTRV